MLSLNLLKFFSWYFWLIQTSFKYCFSILMHFVTSFSRRNRRFRNAFLVDFGYFKRFFQIVISNNVMLFTMKFTISRNCCGCPIFSGYKRDPFFQLVLSETWKISHIFFMNSNLIYNLLLNTDEAFPMLPSNTGATNFLIR